MPKFRLKVVAIEGDFNLPGLGISIANKELLLREVSTVFNVAATVRFDEKLKEAVTINVNGTKEIINLCKQMHHLKVFLKLKKNYIQLIFNFFKIKFF